MLMNSATQTNLKMTSHTNRKRALTLIENEHLY